MRRPENSVGCENLLFVVSRIFRLRFGTALGFRGERSEEFFLGKLPVEGASLEAYERRREAIGETEWMKEAAALLRAAVIAIESLFDEIGREVRVLFDRRDPASLLWPRRQAFLDLLTILNAPPAVKQMLYGAIILALAWLYARTSPGTKLTTVQHHPWVAFEVDEVHARASWQSVVVRGTIYFLEPDRGGTAAADGRHIIPKSRPGQAAGSTSGRLS